MLSKSQYLYQAKLIIDCLPKEEYDSIPKKTLNYIEENMQVDPNIKINPDISLEEQDIDPQTWKFLKDVVNEVDSNQLYEEYKYEINDYVKDINEQNKGNEARLENINLNNDMDNLKKENQKLPQAKDLIVGYQKLISQKDEEIKKLKQECDSLTDSLNRIPKFIKRLFLRNRNLKALNEKNN